MSKSTGKLISFFNFLGDVCAQPLPTCPGAETVFGFDVNVGDCVSLSYDNCQDSGNVFLTEAECRARCTGRNKLMSRDAIPVSSRLSYSFHQELM